jgi:hypothetical protein
MRAAFPEKLERGRIANGYFASQFGEPFGAFFVQGPCGAELKIIAADGQDTAWEHVSVSTERRPPNWQEMSFVKDLFWQDEECVVQFHPPKSTYINNHPHCLHLWKPTATVIPLPPPILVGIK